MTISIPVATPRFWWRAPASQLRAWVSSDPDVDDGGRSRWDDRDQQRWILIAEVVADVGDALANGGWETDDENDLYGFVNIDRDSSSLTATELKIISSWFRHAEAVRVDPWFDSLTNGRHRLWATLPHFAERQVPICSDALSYANPSDAEVLSATWPSLYVTDLEQLAALEWFDDTDPLNRAFVSSVRTAATGVFPPKL
ncbi:hypothetical protein G7066_00685 [Leucobacter coleopterorum]|uniref:Uncharacterized protein n=1 Tax=Leucobacter coleopterorum TaxID=2714933 RepID=A0ABX6JXU0_9MICO|nr:hypothetical protein [Leucobacter coleopterorum]QIM17595.1 hypothetical protein G7066_00685 [Leucobacter coleopterorum]